jgi:N-hydroxyarylamine O-acetyltransferase
MALTGPRIDGYLARLGVTGRPPPTAEVLRALHAAHLLAVPFENASVRFREPIALGEAALVDKIVERGRGGFCFELNGAFAALLEALGFRVTLLGARPYAGGRRLGPPLDHLALRVDLDEPWLADVGFGYSFLAPLRLDIRTPQEDPAGWFQIDDGRGPGIVDVRWRHADGWRYHYRVEPTPRILADLEPSCWFHRTSPASIFTTGWRCARALPDGWVTLRDRRLVITREATREESDLDDAGLRDALASWFGVEVAPGADVDPAPPITR